MINHNDQLSIGTGIGILLSLVTSHLGVIGPVPYNLMLIENCDYFYMYVLAGDSRHDIQGIHTFIQADTWKVTFFGFEAPQHGDKGKAMFNPNNRTSRHITLYNTMLKLYQILCLVVRYRIK